MCVENSMRQNCPVCFEYLFDSVRPTAVLPCGHTIHSDCLKEMEKNRQLACPICMKSYDDLAPVQSHLLPEAFGCKGWLTRKVATVAELDAALDAIDAHDGAAYIEVMIPDEESQPLPDDVIDRGYKLRTPRG